jgi:hypothetical protein
MLAHAIILGVDLHLGGSHGPWSYGSWINNYICNQCLSPLMLRVRISIKARCTTLCDKVCQWLATGQWFSPGPPVSSINKTDCHDITEILLKVALNTIKQTNRSPFVFVIYNIIDLNLNKALLTSNLTIILSCIIETKFSCRLIECCLLKIQWH